MAESKLVVSDYAELLALHKTVMAAKFATRPEHPEVCGSPLVAAVAERTVEVLRELDLRTHGEERAREWDEWQKAEPQRLEWQRAPEQVNAGSRPWKDWSAEEGPVRKFVFVSHTIPESGEGGTYGEASREGVD